MICSHCKTEVPDGAKYCPRCQNLTVSPQGSAGVKTQKQTDNTHPLFLRFKPNLLFYFSHWVWISLYVLWSSTMIIADKRNYHRDNTGLVVLLALFGFFIVGLTLHIITKHLDARKRSIRRLCKWSDNSLDALEKEISETPLRYGSIQLLKEFFYAPKYGILLPYGEIVRFKATFSTIFFVITSGATIVMLESDGTKDGLRIVHPNRLREEWTEFCEELDARISSQRIDAKPTDSIFENQCQSASTANEVDSPPSVNADTPIDSDEALWRANKTCFKKCLNFSGRANRSEFWWFSLCYLVIGLFVIGLFTDSRESGFKENILAVLGSAYLLVAMLPLFSVTIRRLHDTGQSGWRCFLFLVPMSLRVILGRLESTALCSNCEEVLKILSLLSLFGGVFLLFKLCMKSESSENRYGPKPVSF